MLTTGPPSARRPGAECCARLPGLLLAVFLAGGVVTAGSRARAEILFAAPFLSFEVGSDPNSLAVGDVNGDGNPDLAVANVYDSTVSVLLGNGDGTFETKTDYGTGSGPWSVAMGDVDGDETLDLAVANFLSSTVSVLLGNGDGTFGTKTVYGTGWNPNSVAIGDVNGDGKPDLAVANYGSNTVSVLMNVGSGSAGISASGPTRQAWLTEVFPNPTRGPVTLQFAVPRAGRVGVGVYDVTGRLVWSAPDQALAPGAYSLPWDGRDEHGSPVVPGVYYVQVRADGQRSGKRLVVLR